MVTTVYLVRHCQSTGNTEGRFQGRFDAPVGEEGRKQLALLALRFRNEPLDALYSSPLTRAMETARAVNEYHHLPIQQREGLLEISAGDIENMLVTEVARRYPELTDHWNHAPDRCEFPHGETMEQVYTRVNRELDEIIAENPGRRMFIATHGGVIRNIYARVAHGSILGLRDGAVFGNTGVNVLLAEDGDLRFAQVNDLAHLPENLRRKPTIFSFETEAI